MGRLLSRNLVRTPSAGWFRSSSALASAAAVPWRRSAGLATTPWEIDLLAQMGRRHDSSRAVAGPSRPGSAAPAAIDGCGHGQPRAGGSQAAPIACFPCAAPIGAAQTEGWRDLRLLNAAACWGGLHFWPAADTTRSGTAHWCNRYATWRAHGRRCSHLHSARPPCWRCSQRFFGNLDAM